MTREELIKTKAEEYANVWKLGGFHSVQEMLISIANWADKHPQFVHTDNSQVIANLEAEIERLKNPWISVKDRLPEPNVKVIARWNTGEIFDAWRNDEGIWFIDIITADKPDYWMPIHELKKGE